jgi:biopolymer transport protein ExbD
LKFANAIVQKHKENEYVLKVKQNPIVYIGNDKTTLESIIKNIKNIKEKNQNTSIAILLFNWDKADYLLKELEKNAIDCYKAKKDN